MSNFITEKYNNKTVPLSCCFSTDPILFNNKVTYRPDCELWGIVIDVSDGYKGCGCVGQTKVQVSLHIGGLDNDGVLRHFL